MQLTHNCCKNRESTSPRLRYNPTFVHQPIFMQEPGRIATARCTPTYHSTVLNNEGYNIQTVHAKMQVTSVRPNTALIKTVYSNYSHERRIEDLNPKCQVFHTSKDHWYDHTKEQMLGTVRNCTHRGVSRQRQYLNLASDPVFTDFNYGIQAKKIIAAKLEPKYPEDAPIEHVILQASPKKDFGTEFKPKKASNHENQFGKETIINKVEQKSTKKDFHRNCIPQQELEASRRGQEKARRPDSANKGKKVSFNPTFTVVRGNKIQNRL